MRSYIPGVPLTGLDKLCWSIIVRNVEPKAMRNSSGGTFTETERVSTHEISTFPVRIIKGVEEMWSGWSKQILNVLLKCIDVLARWVLSNLHMKIESIEKTKSAILH